MKMTFEEQLERARARRKAEYDRTLDIVRNAIQPPIDPETVAAKIILAGKRRRAEVPTAQEDTTKLSPAAKAIINAGRKRRNEPEI